MSTRTNLFRYCAYALVLFALSACGGGGGGGGDGGGGGSSGLTYTGNSSSAVLTTTNAGKVATDIIGGDSSQFNATASMSAGSSTALEDHTSSVRLARRLGQDSRRVFEPMSETSRSQVVTAAIPVDQTLRCDSGTIRLSGTLNDNGTGTLTISYNDCRVGGDTLSGQGNMRIDAFDIPNSVITDSTFSYSRLVFRNATVNRAMSGSVRTQVNLFARSDTFTSNVITQDNNTGAMTRSENIVIVDVYNNYFSPSSYTETISGRFYRSALGYVDIATTTPFSFATLSQLRPDSGQLVITGAGNAKIRLTVRSSSQLEIALDLDGNGAFEIIVTIAWADLSGPAGADLGDTDGDGMHNSWETAHGLNPNLADASQDADGDGFSNIIEYRAGTDPRNASAHPAPLLSSSRTSVSFSAFSGESTAPAAASIDITGAPNSIPYTISTIYGFGASGWLNAMSTGTTPDTLSIAPTVTNLAPNAYTATVRLTPTASASGVDIVVTYNVATAPLTLNPTAVTFDINGASNPAAFTRTVNVGTTGPSFTWTASSSVPWLTVTPSGTSGGSATLSLVPAELASVDNGASPAAVTFTYGGSAISSTQRTLNVTLNLQVPKVSYVAPHIAQANTSDSIILRGNGFDSLAGQQLTIGSNVTSAYTRISDTEIVVTHPALSVGTHQVGFTNTLGIDRFASLVVVDPPGYAASSISYPNTTSKQPLNIVYDAERGALFVAVAYPAPGAAGEIFRYTYSGTAWTASSTTAAVPGFRDMALSTDGRKLIAVSETSVRQVDPTTLDIGAPTSPPFGSPGFEYMHHLVATNDGRMLVTTAFHGSGDTQAYRYSVRDSTFTSFGSSFQWMFRAATPGVSANGRHVALQQGGGISPPPDIYRYNSSTGILASTGVPHNQNFLVLPALNRTGSRVVVSGYIVYDGNYSVLGNLPFVQLGTQAAVVLSPDGSKAYTYVSGMILHTYDLNGVPVAGMFPEAGVGTTLPSDPGANARMTISPDGGTLFIAGNSGIVVLPAP